jgi:hypothetical protein
VIGLLIWALTLARPAPAPCGTSAGAQAALRAVRDQFRPGAPIQRLTTLAAPFRNEKERRARPYRQLHWLLSGLDGRRSAVQTVMCDFDEQDIVVQCTSRGDVFETQTVSSEQWEATPDGVSIREGLRTLCSPSDTKTDDQGRVFAEWMVSMPKWHVLGSCLGRRFLSAGRMERKQLLCE